MKQPYRLLLRLAAVVLFALPAACSSDDGNTDSDPDSGSDHNGSKPIHTVIVAQDGTGDHTSLQEAFDALPVDGEPHIVRLRPGTYQEKVTLTAKHPRVTLIGDDATTCIVTWDDYAGRLGENGKALGTSGSQTFLVEADDFTACEVTIANSYVNSQANTAANGKDTQAVSVQVTGDRASFYECRITGYQDTFYGRGMGRIYLRDCYVEGNVDFIFGSSTILLDHCTLHMNRNNSVVTAPSTPANHEYGIICMDCTITFPPSSETDFDGKPFTYFHLGRSWKDAPRAVFVRCEEPAALKAEGWTVMSSTSPAPALFAEYRCTGEGATADRLAQRANGGCQLSDLEGSKYIPANIFAKTSAPENSADWLPSTHFTDPGEE